MTTPAPATTDADIVDTAIAAGDFTTLVAAVQAAGLEDTLRGEGPFTVFAPTDDAFAALPAGTIETLLEDPAGDLTDILTYHVVAGAVPAADVVGLDGQAGHHRQRRRHHRRGRRRRIGDLDRRRRQRRGRGRHRRPGEQRRDPRDRRRPPARLSERIASQPGASPPDAPGRDPGTRRAAVSRERRACGVTCVRTRPVGVGLSTAVPGSRSTAPSSTGLPRPSRGTQPDSGCRARTCGQRADERLGVVLGSTSASSTRTSTSRRARWSARAQPWLGYHITKDGETARCRSAASAITG